MLSLIIVHLSFEGQTGVLLYAKPDQKAVLKA